MIYPLLGSLMSLHGALPLAVADGMPRLVTFFPELTGQDCAFFVVELLGVLPDLLVQSKRGQGCRDQVQQFVV